MAGTRPHTMLAGVITFFICEIIALSTAVIGGSTLDILEVQMAQAGMLDVPEKWNPDAYKPLINIFYICPYIMSLLGLFVLFITIFQRYGIDQSEDEEYYDNQGNQIIYNGGAL